MDGKQHIKLALEDERMKMLKEIRARMANGGVKIGDEIVTERPSRCPNRAFYFIYKNGIFDRS